MSCENLNDITHTRGDSFVRNMFIKTTDSSGVTTPVNLTGSQIKFTLKKNKEDVANVTQVIADIISAVNGNAKISILELDEPLGTYYYDIQMVDAGGFIKTLLKGKFSIVYDITR